MTATSNTTARESARENRIVCVYGDPILCEFTYIDVGGRDITARHYISEDDIVVTVNGVEIEGSLFGEEVEQ